MARYDHHGHRELLRYAVEALRRGQIEGIVLRLRVRHEAPAILDERSAGVDDAHRLLAKELRVLPGEGREATERGRGHEREPRRRRRQVELVQPLTGGRGVGGDVQSDVAEAQVVHHLAHLLDKAVVHPRLPVGSGRGLLLLCLGRGPRVYQFCAAAPRRLQETLEGRQALAQIRRCRAGRWLAGRRPLRCRVERDDDRIEPSEPHIHQRAEHHARQQDVGEVVPAQVHLEQDVGRRPVVELKAVGKALAQQPIEPRKLAHTGPLVREPDDGAIGARAVR